MRKGWKKVRLGDAPVQIIDGDRGKNYPKLDEFTATGYCLFLNTKNVTANGFSFAEQMYITQKKDNLLRKGRLLKGDIVLTTRGTVGNIAFYNDNIPYDNIRINSGMVLLRADTDKIIPEYLYLLVRSSIVQDQIKTLMTGSAQPQLPISSMVKIVFPLPPIQEQRAIAAVLSCLDDKIFINTKINHHLEQMAQAIFKSWFVDFEPWGGEMPDDWREGTISEICSYGSERISVSELTNETYISTENMLANRGGFVNATSLPTTSSTAMFRPGNVLVSNIRPYFKKIIYCSFTGGCSADVLCFQAKNNVVEPYLYCLLFSDTFFDYIVAGSKGTKMPRGDKQQIINYPTVIPHDKILIDFVGLVAPTLSAIESNRDECRNLAALRDTLLPKLMSGELSVADLETAK